MYDKGNPDLGPIYQLISQNQKHTWAEIILMGNLIDLLSFFLHHFVSLWESIPVDPSEKEGEAKIR